MTPGVPKITGAGWVAYHGDCLAVMPSLAAGSVDLILCDLPYGMTQNAWDSVIPFARLWAAYTHVLKSDGVVVLTAVQPFTSALVMSNPRWFRHHWIWEKTAPTGHLNAKRAPLRAHEDVLVFSPVTPQYNPQGLREFGRVVRRGAKGGNGSNYGASGTENFRTHTGYPRTVLRVPHDKERRHPTQKPVALLEYLVSTYSNIGETVLDNTMGSGSTGVACARTGRAFIGIERDATYFDAAVLRLAAHEKTEAT